MSEIVIRPIETTAEAEQLDDLQVDAWGYDDRRLTSWESLIVFGHTGSVLLGAFDGDRLVGHVFGIYGTQIDSEDVVATPITADGMLMYSHQLAVRPSYRQSGLGRQLKLAQRDEVLSRGVPRIVWTFDPLVSRNAWLNLGRLGAVVRRFKTDYYGPGNHRCFAEWWIDSDRVHNRLAGDMPTLSYELMRDEGIPIVNPTSAVDGGLPAPPPKVATYPFPSVLLEIPHDFDVLAAANSDLAEQWRQHAVALFVEYLDQGYVLTELVRHEDEYGRKRSFYLAKKEALA